MARCPLPPQGWYCSRPAGHRGPCAAWPEHPTGEVLEAQRDMQGQARRRRWRLAFILIAAAAGGAAIATAMLGQ